MFFKKILALAMLAAVLLPLVVSADSAGTFPAVGRMFFDLNGDGEWGAHERSIVGKVTLSQGGVALKKIKTNDAGGFEFEVTPGVYRIDGRGDSDVAGPISGFIEFSAESGGGPNWVSLPVRPPGLCWNAISGFVFIDENRNGAMDRGESAVPGAKIAFQQAVVTVSNDRGYYAIDLVCGEYEVIATAPDLIGRTVVSVGEVVAGLTNIPMAPVKRQLLPLIIGH